MDAVEGVASGNEDAVEGVVNDSPLPFAQQETNVFNFCIRANQGHSLDGINPEYLLQEIPMKELATLPTIVHGTYFEAWRQIQAAGGLNRMNRTHIHSLCIRVVEQKRVWGRRRNGDFGNACFLPSIHLH